MHEINLLEAFASYKVRPARRTRSAMTLDGDLVMSCWYAGFKRAQAEILRYEEDLSGQTSEIATALRTHLARALSNECEVHPIVALAAAATVDPKAADTERVKPARTSYYARKDLVGRVCSFDGERFMLEFRRTPMPVQSKLSKSARLQGKVRLAGR
jgi:hypothetical protein